MDWQKIAIILVCEILAIILVIPGSFASKTIKNEMEMAYSYLGGEGGNFIDENGRKWKDSVYYDTGFYDAAYWMFIPTEEERQKSRGLENLGTIWFKYAESRLEALEDVIHMAANRYAMLLLWMPAIVILLIPALVDGHMSRRIKQSSFNYSSPILHHYAGRFIALISFALAMLFTLPFSLNPIILPIALMLVAVAFGIALGNFQKRI